MQTIVAPKDAMSKENFNRLLASHNDGEVTQQVSRQIGLDTNTSAFDRINLGPFYEEHQRQKELLEDDWNRRRSPTRKHGVRRSQRCENLVPLNNTGSVPDVALRDAKSEQERWVYLFCLAYSKIRIHRQRTSITS